MKFEAVLTDAIRTKQCMAAILIFGTITGCDKSPNPPTQHLDGHKQEALPPLLAGSDGSIPMRWFYKSAQDGGPMALYGLPDSDADVLMTCSLAGITVSLNWVDEKPFRARSILNSGDNRFETETTFDAAAEVPTAKFVVPYNNPILGDMPDSGFTVSYQNGERNTFPSDPLVAKLIGSCRSIFGKTETALINIWYDAEDICRGAYDDAPTAAACLKRNDLTRKLGRLNMCYGRDGEYGYQYQWHRCGPGSMKP